MTVSVQRDGHFRYMMTFVHDDFGTYEINFGTCVFCNTTSVHAKYPFSTSLCRYRYISKERLSFYAEGLQMLNGCLVCYVKLLMCNWTFLFTASNIDHRRPIRERIIVNKHVTSDVQVYVTEASTPRACHIAVHIVNVRTTATAKSITLEKRYLKVTMCRLRLVRWYFCSEDTCTEIDIYVPKLTVPIFYMYRKWLYRYWHSMYRNWLYRKICTESVCTSVFFSQVFYFSFSFRLVD